jgi:osmoprotectant transport system permease protein
LGFYISSRPNIAKYVINVASIMMTIPSLALYGVMVVLLAPFKLGLGIVPSISFQQLPFILYCRLLVTLILP